MVFFQHSAWLGNNIGLFKPKERHTSLHRWPYQKHSWQGLEVSRENHLDKSTEMVITSNHYIYNIYIYIIKNLMHLVLFHCNDIFQMIYHKCYIIVSYMHGIVYGSFYTFLYSISVSTITFDLLQIWTINIIITNAILNIKNYVYLIDWYILGFPPSQQRSPPELLHL